MNLLSANLADLTFEQLDSFLNAKQAENIRLEYKACLPQKEFGKHIVAFANTFGGLIILGVDENAADNTPVWPPTKTDHLQTATGHLVNQVENIASALYPPVPITLSPIIPNPHAVGRCLLVIRVDESREAPHAEADKEGVYYVAERTKTSSNRFRRADIDRIEKLLERRRKVESARVTLIEDAISSVAKVMVPNSTMLITAVVPTYPWRRLLDREKCLASHKVPGADTPAVPIPDGSRIRFVMPGKSTTWVSEAKTHGLFMLLGPVRRTLPAAW